MQITNAYAAFDKFNRCINAVYRHKNNLVRTEIISLNKIKTKFTNKNTWNQKFLTDWMQPFVWWSGRYVDIDYTFRLRERLLFTGSLLVFLSVYDSESTAIIFQWRFWSSLLWLTKTGLMTFDIIFTEIRSHLIDTFRAFFCFCSLFGIISL